MANDYTYYAALPYARRAKLESEDEERFWLAWIEELPGCKVEASTKAEAYLELGELFREYIEAKLERGSLIPQPARVQYRGPAVARRVIAAALFKRSGESGEYRTVDRGRAERTHGAGVEEVPRSALMTAQV